MAIELDISASEIEDILQEYWVLNQLDELALAYYEIRNDLDLFLKLFRVMKKNKSVNRKDIQAVIRYATFDLPALENRCQILSSDVLELRFRKKKLGDEVSLQSSTISQLEKSLNWYKIDLKKLQQLTDSIQNDHKTLEENYSVISQQKHEIFSLNKEKTRLENIINSVQLNSETCVKINQIVKQEVESIVSNPTRLIRLALAALFESSRKHPGKLQALYYNMPSHFSVEQILSQSSISQNSSQYIYSENEDEKLLLDEAEQSYNRIANAITNTCINEMPNNTESSSQMLQASHEQDIGSNREIFDTGDLSGANLTYNNITFHVYSVLKIANERKVEQMFGQGKKNQIAITSHKSNMN